MARVLRSDEEIAALTEVAQRWLKNSPRILDPKAFLASVDQKIWIAVAAVVSRDGRPIGLAYCKERKIAGFGTGMLYGDATLNAMVLSDPADRVAVFRTALTTLIQRRGVRAIRLLVPPDGAELNALQEIRESLSIDLSYAPAENHSALGLSHSYESFLAKLSHSTRYNFRRYRRKFEQLGHQYVPRLSWPEFQAATAELLQKSVVGADPNGVQRALRIYSEIDRPFFAGLRHRDGRWLSVVGGWHEKDHAMIFSQMNDDQDHPDYSLSLVMRAYLIEDVIAEGIPTMIFWAGVGYPLRRYCEQVPSLKAFLDRRGLLWSTSRALLVSATRLFPKKMRWAADWIGSVRSDGL